MLSADPSADKNKKETLALPPPFLLLGSQPETARLVRVEGARVGTLFPVQSYTHTWLRGHLCVLCFQGRPRVLGGFGAMLAGFVSQEAVLVQVHHEELVELHVLMALQGRAVAGPAEPLQVDAEALWQLRAEGKGKTQAVQRLTAPPPPERAQVQSPPFLVSTV